MNDLNFFKSKIKNNITIFNKIESFFTFIENTYSQENIFFHDYYDLFILNSNNYNLNLDELLFTLNELGIENIFKRNSLSKLGSQTTTFNKICSIYFTKNDLLDVTNILNKIKYDYNFNFISNPAISINIFLSILENNNKNCLNVSNDFFIKLTNNIIDAHGNGQAWFNYKHYSSLFNIILDAHIKEFIKFSFDELLEIYNNVFLSANNIYDIEHDEKLKSLFTSMINYKNSKYEKQIIEKEVNKKNIITNYDSKINKI